MPYVNGKDRELSTELATSLIEQGLRSLGLLTDKMNIKLLGLDATIKFEEIKEGRMVSLNLTNAKNRIQEAA